MINNLFSVTDQRIVITGAGRGLGRSMALGLAALGAKVALIARSADPLAQAIKDIAEQGGTALALPADVTSPESIGTAFQSVVDEWGGIDAVISNAGTNIRKPIAEIEDNDWRQVLNTNLDGTFHVCREAAKHLRDNGRILMIGSVAGHVAIPTGLAYAASKGAIEQMTRTLAQELGPKNITVNCIAPWYFKTPLTQALLDDPQYLQRVMAATPIKTLGPIDNLVGLAAFLCGPSASWLTGQVISLDGGFSAAKFNPPTQ